MHVCSLKVEVCPRVGQNGGFVVVQEHQSTVIWTSVDVGESGLSADAHHLQWFGLLCGDAVQEGFTIADGLPTPSVILGGVGPIDAPGGIEGRYDSVALLVTVTVESSSSEAVDAGLVEEMESDMSEEGQQLHLLIIRQAGRDSRHDGQIAAWNQIQTPDWLSTVSYSC